ncbi:hypothetical protein C0581_03680 [Candidatus Parcubacteria bacterium]|nr:MAG: hypothetical protein C0581_03680 [Candidatus Parcubacteria bacterium]
MKKRILLSVLSLMLVPSMVLGFSWTRDSAVEIQQNLASNYEPSGVIWNPDYNALFVVSDEGDLTKINIDGSNETAWRIGGDLEGLTIDQSDPRYIYIAKERPFALIKFDPINGTIVKNVSLVGVVPAVSSVNQGIEAVAYVPNGDHTYSHSPNGGLFYLGVQEGGRIHVVDVNFGSGNAVLVDSFVPVSGRGDLAGLHYNYETKTIFILYDSSNRLREIKTDKTFVEEYVVPGNAQEGVTFLPGCPSGATSIFIAEDYPSKVLRYDGFPLSCPVLDTDGDGVTDDMDMCEGYDDAADLDQDGTPDGCDTIDNRDDDNDGIVNEYDMCPGHDDAIDTDADNIPDGCDTVDNRDSDNDGVINEYDICVGYDDNLDVDSDGIPDGCDDTDDRFCAANIGELGKTSVIQEDNAQWHTVNLQNTYIDPVVIAQMSTYNGSNPAHIRLRNVGNTSFEFQIEEWDYLDQWHTTEEITYIVMERGSYEVNGVMVDVGSATLKHNFKTVTYGAQFENVPVVLSQAQTYNGGQAVVTRQKNIDTNSFSVKLKEEEGNDGSHANEEVGYIAIEGGSHMLGNTFFNAIVTPDNVTHSWQTVNFSSMNNPFFFSMMQSHDGGDSAGMRHRNVGSNSVEIMIEEEQSRDSEMSHTTESVGYLVLDGVGTITTELMCSLN